MKVVVASRVGGTKVNGSTLFTEYPNGTMEDDKSARKKHNKVQELPSS